MSFNEKHRLLVDQLPKEYRSYIVYLIAALMDMNGVDLLKITLEVQQYENLVNDKLLQPNNDDSSIICSRYKQMRLIDEHQDLLFELLSEVFDRKRTADTLKK